MPRILPERPKRLFRGAEFTRLMTMVVMLFVLGMMIKTAQDPDTWKWLVSKPGKPDQVVAEGNSNDKPQREVVPPNAVSSTSASTASTTIAAASPAPAEKPATTPAAAASTSTNSPGQPSASTTTSAAPLTSNKIPPATGPTDEDEAEAIASEEDFDFIVDNAIELHPEEQAAYERITRWVVNQPYERLAARAMSKNPTYSSFVTNPDDLRKPGKLFSFVVHVRMAYKFDTKLIVKNEDDPHDPIPLYYMWGTIDEAPGRLLYFLVYDPPAGLPLGKDLREDVRFVGYFFRVQGYIPAKADLNAKVQPAPSFIGRIAWKARAPGVVLQSSELPWLIALAGGAAVILLAWTIYFLVSRRRPGHSISNLAPPPALTVENWLDQVDSGEVDEEDANGFAEHDYSDRSEFHSPNGHSNGSRRVFPDPKDDG